MRMFLQQIEDQLPFMRRYARAACGSREAGDRATEEAIVRFCVTPRMNNRQANGGPVGVGGVVDASLTGAPGVRGTDATVGCGPRADDREAGVGAQDDRRRSPSGRQGAVVRRDDRGGRAAGAR